jgi:hypothetical protein
MSCLIMFAGGFHRMPTERALPHPDCHVCLLFGPAGWSATGRRPTATAQTPSGRTALQVTAAVACGRRHVDAVQLLLVAGASPAARCHSGTLALHVAAIQGHTAAVEKLA